MVGWLCLMVWLGRLSGEMIQSLRTDFTRSSHPGRGLGAECCREGIANAKAVRQERPCQGQQAKKKKKKSRPWACGWSLERKGSGEEDEVRYEGDSHILWSPRRDFIFLCNVFIL